MYGFAKNDRDNIDDDELQTFRTIGANRLIAEDATMTQVLSDGELKEIDHDEEA